MIDENTIRQWWYLFKGEGCLTEIRLLPKKSSRGRTYSGYFTDIETLLQQLRPFADTDYGIYATLNSIDSACYGRDQRDRFVDGAATTSDKDIAGRDYILVDFDPKRPSGTNSSEGEKAAARRCVNRVYAFLRDQGFSQPVVADSANGYHLYYRVALENTPERRQLVSDFLGALAMMFSDDGTEIDVSVFNAGRIVKVIGTRSNKGADTPERPRRTSRFVSVPEDFRPTDVAYVRKVADLLPRPEAQGTGFRGAREEFDLEKFFSEHGIAVHSVGEFPGGTKYVLEECPFDSSHRAPDAAVFRMKNGALGFRCLHNSCQHYGWKDFRLHYDPGAYDRRDWYEHLHLRRYYAPPLPPEEQPQERTEEAKGEKWLSLSGIEYVDPSTIPHVPTGITALDRKIMGLMTGDVTIISGLSGSGKTSLLDNLILNIVEKGWKVAAWSGELQDFRFQMWIDQMAAGRNYVRPAAGYDGLYFAPRNVCAKINGWLDGKFWLYNNEYGSRWSRLFGDIRSIVEEKGVRVVVLDNLMALSLDLQGEKNDRQTAFINSLKDYAKKSGVHVLLVCHPRKEQSFQLLRMESIAGTADLSNLCDNLFIVHRFGDDFERRAKDFYGAARIEGLKARGYDVVMEVCKNRSYGLKDWLVGLYYEPESRRLKNEKSEYVHYGWEESCGPGLPRPLPRDTEFDDMEGIGDLPF